MSSSTSSAAVATASPPEPSTRTTGAITAWACLGAATVTTAIHALLQLAGLPAASAGAVAALTALVVIGAWISIVDVREHRIPNHLTIILAAALTGASHHALLAAGAGALAMLAAYLVAHYVGQMGFGDVKLATVCGLALGAQGPEILVLGFCAGFILALPAALLHTIRRQQGNISFGPWLLAGAIAALAASLVG